MSGGARLSATPFGRLAVLDLPAEDDAAGLEELAAALSPEEQAHARGLPDPRRHTWVGGRVALRAALADIGVAAGPVLATERGAPVLPAGVLGSIAHKRSIAVALASLAPSGAPEALTIGVDVEIDLPPRFDISSRVLTPGELGRLAALPAAARPRAVVRAFAAKEAVYKALDPWLRRFVGFGEVEVDGADGRARFAPRAGEPAFEIDLHEVPLAGHLLVTARVQRRAG
jgi:4'-phosphopantetheinyl transferase EntD